VGNLGEQHHVAALKARTGAHVAIHELDAPVLSGERRPQKRPLVPTVLYVLLMQHVTPDRLLRDGDTIGGLQVVHVPGHTAGSIALVRGGDVLFSGDALLTDKHGNVIPLDPRQTVRGQLSQDGSCPGRLTVGIRRIGSFLTPREGPTGVLTALAFR